MHLHTITANWKESEKASLENQKLPLKAFCKECSMFILFLLKIHLGSQLFRSCRSFLWPSFGRVAEWLWLAPMHHCLLLGNLSEQSPKHTSYTWSDFLGSTK